MVFFHLFITIKTSINIIDLIKKVIFFFLYTRPEGKCSVEGPFCHLFSSSYGRVYTADPYHAALAPAAAAAAYGVGAMVRP